MATEVAHVLVMAPISLTRAFFVSNPAKRSLLMSDEKGDGEPTSPKSDKDDILPPVETTDSPRGGRSNRDGDEDGDRDRSRNKHRSGDRRKGDRDRERDRERDHRDSHRSSRDYRPRDRDSRSRSYHHDRKPDRDDRPRKPILDEFGRDITLRNVDRERGRNDRRDFKKDERTDGKGDGKPDERRSDNKRPRDAADDDPEGAKRQKVEEAEEIDEEPEPELSLEALGLPVGFNSTKGKKVEGNDVGGSQVISKRIYRQYMNRRGGFNRNLEPDRNAERYTTKPAKPKTGLPAKAGKPKGSKK